ncbi:MAG TPA: FAD-dependent monooxygenase, partial [Clostridia bacterium]|nr:FAD-dependent monooxygenase [Clostridia bacterium]
MTVHVQPHEIPVLVVGAGPAGLTMAAGLARHGVGSLLVERHETVSVFPKASGISTRTMEILRSWGLEDAVRAASLRALPLMSVGETLTGPSQAIAPLGFPTDEQALAVSPTRPAIAPQDRVEPILLEFARRQSGVEIRFGTELVGLDQDPDGVTATLRDLDSGREEIVRARYLVGADGSRSAVRAMLGIEAHGPSDLGTYLTMLFRADLWSALGERRFGLYQLTGPVPGVFVPTGPDDRWVLGMPFDPRSDDPGAFTPERCVELIRRAAGLPDLAVELLASMPITFMAQAAERVRDGRAFLVGDAAHRMPPMGGRGLNTAVADAYGLSWKLAWVVRGLAGEALLGTHEAERGPVGRFNLMLAAPNAPAATPDGLREDLGYVYRSAAIDADDGSDAAPGHVF